MRIIYILMIFAVLSCNTESKNPLETILSSDNEKIKLVMNDLESHEVQILYTEIIRDKTGKVSFNDYDFQVNDSIYFYPASAVKFPIAVLALEKLNEQNDYNRSSNFYVEGDSIETTFTREIEKIFAVSDNEAFNRLFEYLGKDDINYRLQAKGINARISHRLSTENSDELTTKPIIFYLNDSTTTSTEEIINSPIEMLPLKNVLKGIGYIESDSLIYEPKDFSAKNYLPITSLHKMMKQLFFPELYPKSKQFILSDGDRSFLLKTMKILPKEAGFSSNDYYDSYVKFLIFGDTKENIPKHIEIYNKVGYAYGYLTDCAYIINKTTNREYIITATIYVNKDGIFNDDIYEYEGVGIPFLAELGRQLVLK